MTLPRLKSALLLCIIFVSTITTLPILNPTNVGAAKKISEQNFDWQIQSTLYYKAVAECISKTELSSSYFGYPYIKNEDAKSGKWLAISGSSSTIGVYMKTATNNNTLGVIENGNIWCDQDKTNLISTALSFWGLDPIETLCNSGFKRDKVDGVQSIEQCKSTPTSFIREDGQKSDTVTKFTEYIKSAVYDNANIGITNKATLYLYYRHSLDQSCIPGIDGTAPGTSIYQDSLGEGYNDIDWVSPEGTIINGSYVGYRDHKWKTQIGMIVPPTKFLGDDYTGTIKCSDLAAYLKKGNEYSLAYSDWAETNPEEAADFGQYQETAGGVATPTKCGIEGVGWIVCPVINFMASLTDKMFGLFRSFLTTSPSMLNTDSAATVKDSSGNPKLNADGTQQLVGTTTFQAWQLARNIANIAFVIIFLIIIFSQITSFGITNYGIKKMLPRLIIAAVLVNISFYICQIGVDLSNAIGYGVQSLLNGLGATATSGAVADGGWAWTDLLGNVMVGVGAVAAVMLGALAVIIPAILAAFVALLMILFILIGRQVIIILLVILSPLAFVAFLLPNTEKLFKTWQKTFMSMLMLFPIVAGVFGVSELASKILGPIFDSSPDPVIGTVGKIAAMIVLILPLFVVPGLLKKSLDGIGSLGTKINALGTKAGSALGKKGSKAYDNTALARGRAIREQAKTNFRNQKFAKSLGKNGPRSFFARSHAPIKLGAGKYANEQLERSALATSNALTKTEIEQEAIKITENSTPINLIDNAKDAFEKAVKDKDSIKARAAQSILLKTSKGRDELHKSYLDNDTMEAVNENATLSSGLRNDLNSAGLKGSDQGLATLGYTAGTLKDIDSKPGTYSGLNYSEIAGQSVNTLRNIQKIGAMSSETASQILINPITQPMLGDKAKIIGEIASTQPPAGPTPTPPPAGPTPTVRRTPGEIEEGEDYLDFLSNQNKT